MKFPLHLLLILLIAGGNLVAAPKETPTPPPPPMPQDQNVAIYRGRTVEIPLRAIGRANGQLKFLIRQKPKYGKLGEIKFTGSKSAIVTYIHNESAGVTPDSFTYAVQSVGTAVSAPGRVNIAVSENPPAFSVVHSLDFATITIGEPREEEVTIRNTGGGTISGKIIAPAPWKVIGEDTYELGRKQEKRIRIQFDPDDSRDYTEKLVFSHDARSPVTLTGKAVSPFEFEPPGNLTASSEGTDTVRLGGLTVRNITDRERVVEIKTPPHISAPDQVSVGAGGEARIPFYTSPEYLQEIDGELLLESEGFRRTIPLRAAAVRPIIQVEPSVLDFGEIAAGTRHNLTLKIKNAGGTPARLRILMPPDFLLTPDPNSAVLEPGKSLTFQAVLETLKPGNYQFEVEIDADSSASLRVPINAQVTRPVGPSVKIPPSSPIAPLAPEAKPVTAESLKYHSNVPRIEKININPIGRRTVEVSWPTPAANAESVVIEQRMILPDGNSTWKRLNNGNIKISDRDGQVVVRFENLAPSQIWFLRFSHLDQNEHQSVPSATIRIATPPAPPPWALWISVAVLVVAVGGFFGYKIHQSRRAEVAEEASRMARIEDPH